MVGALGTLGVLGELTLRLHPRPEFEVPWIATFPAWDAAGEFVERVLDSTIQPSRLEVLNRAALRAVAKLEAAVGLAISIGSVEAAVCDQGIMIEELAHRASGQIAVAPDDFWAAYDRVFGPEPESRTKIQEVVLQVNSLTSELAGTAHAIERGVERFESTTWTAVTGCAAVGKFRVLIRGAETERIPELIHDLRAFVGGFDGTVIVERGPAALRTRIDPWGPIPPGTFALMQALKHEFDPTSVLNPGRFAGGL